LGAGTATFESHTILDLQCREQKSPFVAGRVQRKSGCFFDLMLRQRAGVLISAFAAGEIYKVFNLFKRNSSLKSFMI
jgi:hypothetical protein